MAKYRVRVSAKGKRWRKGQSSSSNPTSTKFRDAARTGFFQPLKGESNLTKDALQKHDALTNTLASKEADSNEIEESSVEDAISFGGKTFKTFDTFASDWSQCSNTSFNKLLLNFKSDSAVHKELLAVLAAVTEVIKERGGSESSTEYFAALMTALDSEDNDETAIHAILTLLSMGIKSVPSSVLQVKFSPSTKTLMTLLARFAEAENVAILRPIIGCLSVLLRNQEAAAWNDPSTIQVLDSLLAFITFTKPKIRKAAQHGVVVTVRQSNMTAGGRSHVARHCIRLVEGVAAGGVTATLHVLTLLKDIMHTFPKKELKECCEAVLKVMTMNNVLVSSCGLQALHGLMSNRPDPDSLPPQRNARLVTALYDYQPPPTDSQPTQAWVATLQQAFLNLAKNDMVLCHNNLVKFFKTLSSLYLGEKVEVMSSVTHALSEVLEGSFSSVTQQSTPWSLQTAGQIAQHLTDCLSYQYHSAWTHILHLMATLFKSCSSSYASVLGPCLKALGSLRDSNQFAYNNEVDAALGNAVRSIGPQVVLQAIPFMISPADEKREFKRSWLLPILKDSVQGSNLGFFTEYFLPQAVMCSKEADRLKSENDQIGSLSYDLLQTQIWSLLPSFCNQPTDITASFPTIAKALGGVLSTKKDLRMSVLSALRKLVSSSLESNNAEDLKTMSRYAKNYVPIFFSSYMMPAKGTDEEGTRLAIYETIKVYLKITSKELCAEFFQKAFDKLNESDEDGFRKTSILDLMRLLIPYQAKGQIDTVFKNLMKNITNTTNHKEQKKYFRLMEELCTAETDDSKLFLSENLDSIKELLLNSLSTSAASSKGARLRCILELVRRWENPSDLVESVVPETVLCVKDVNSKCRSTAYTLLVEMADHVEPEQYLFTVMAGLAGSPSAMSCSLLALAAIVYHYKEKIPKQLEDQLLENVGIFLTCNTREVVTAALSFIKVYIQCYPRSKIAAFIPTLMKLLSKMSEEVRRGCRTKVRDILSRLVRWYGGDAVLRVVPAHDTVLRARVRNLSKIHARRKKAKQEQAGQAMETDEFAAVTKHKSIEEILAESDSDLDLDEEDVEKPKKKTKGNAWITETVDDIVDFTDLATSKKISASKPAKKDESNTYQFEKKKSKKGFNKAPDGRLIIADEVDSEEEETKKKIIPGLDDSDDDSAPSEDEASVESAPKAARKRKFSVSTTGTQNKYVAGGSGIHRPIKNLISKKSKRGENRGPAVTSGKLYKAKKAGGDRKKKGMPDPYAYIPLERAKINRRNRMKASGEFKNFIKSARKGAKIAKYKLKKKQR